jgi:autotransporter passenger strand-loop-strand repeat protein
MGGGLEIVRRDGTDSGALISGGTQRDDGLANGATVFAGGVQVVDHQGTASGTIVSSGGTLELLEHGSAGGYQIDSGGTLEVGRHASLSGATVSNGVTLLVSRGEVASTTVLSGGTLELLRHGRQTDTKFESGATFELGDKHEKLSGFTAANGVTLKVVSGGTLIDDTISSGGSLVINGQVDVRGTLTDGGTTSIGDGAILQTRDHATAILGGSIINSGTLFARKRGTEIDIVSGATVSGNGTAEIGNGIVNIQAVGDNQDVIFWKHAHGGLDLPDTAADPTAFGGTVSGFRTEEKQFIDLTGVTSDGTVSLSYSSTTSSSGVLTVSSGGSAVADINMFGSYTTSSFHLASGSGGTVEILGGRDDHDADSDKPEHSDAAKTAATDSDKPADSGAAKTAVPDSDKPADSDPAKTAATDSDKPADSDPTKTAATDLKQWFDPNATFAGTVAGGDQNAVLPTGDQQNSPAQTTTDTTGTDLGNPVRLANYMASTFVGQGDGYGDQMIANSGESVAQQPFLANPH